MNVELVYEHSCPNIAAAREQVLKAFANTDVTPCWQEWDVALGDAPDHVRHYGSPTILVDGEDVTGEAASRDDLCCRIYDDSESTNPGVPPLAQVEAALRAARSRELASASRGRWRLFGMNLALLPTIGAALLPKLACPACWPAYAGVLTALGIGFFDYTPYLLPAMLLFVASALFTLAFRARQRHGYGPFILGLLASGPLLASKFHFDSDLMMWTSLAWLVGASLWNAWPGSPSPQATCSGCEHGGKVC